MNAKKQPESSAGVISESLNDWFRAFLKHLEINMADAGQSLRADADSTQLCLAAIHAVKLTLRDSGVGEDEIVELFGRIVLQSKGMANGPEWNAELNKRRFQLGC